ncbi:SCO family protein [Coraliomargarita sp. SDUM461004]|uniref:SCO family protein n=1 Tax=Thalassobacterium sedimentorum TaxID=3041258 RepID=A0ABU1AEQ7_9BACT|nr:SCO family protein [Coraliomargarita sp. SDUM461004]MDQ8193277.1 SCO family protein [Coraliomargarita sp. SDUM461004]
MTKNSAIRPSLKTCALGLALLFASLPQLLQAEKAKPLYEGDALPQTQLINENGAPIELTSSDQPTVITFIFTRCAAMQFCPRMNAQFEALQAQAQKDATLNLRLVSISLDPEFDRPERLKEYGPAIGADPTIWQFATGSTDAIDQLTQAFRVHRDKSKGVLNHTLCTALIAPDGRIQKIWRGNAWEVDEVIAALRK